MVLACSLVAFGQTPRSDIVTLQNAVAATGNGTAFEVGLYGGVAVQVTGTFSATITFEATIDRTNWIAIRADNLNDRSAATTATAAGIYQVPLSGVLQFRARVSSYSSGNVTVKARGVAGVISLKQSSGGGGGGSVDSVFGRTGTVVAAQDDYTFAQLASKPTTLSGYGITDGQSLDADLTAIAALSPSNDDVIQRKAGAWTNRTVAQFKTDLGLATIATSGSASDLSGGTVPLARLSGITNSQLDASAGITNGQLAGSIAISKLSISGTPDGTKFLRDDGSWQTVSGGGSPGGSDTQLQRNNAGVFGGISGVTSDGTNVTAGSGNLRATSPRITTSILDTNGNTLLGITANASATEYITIANNTATNAVSLTASSPTVAASAQAGTPLNLTASPAIAGNVNVGAAAGGSITFTAGNAARLTSGNANGGDYNFVATSGIGTGRAGVVFVPSGTSVTNPGGIQFGTSVLNGISAYGSAIVTIQNGLNSLYVNNGVGTAIAPGACYTIASGTNDATSTRDTFICRSAAASIRLGSTDAASPVAQTLSVQNVVAGTSNTAGVNWTFNGSRGTGTGAGGSIVFQTAPAGSSGTSQNALVTAVTIPSTGGLLFPELSSAPATPASNNVQLYAKDNGSGVSNLYFKKDDGVEVNLSAVGSGIASINSDTTSAQTISGADDLTASTSSGTTTIQRVTNNAANVALMLPSMGGIPVVTDSASALVGSNNEIRVALIQVTQKATYNNVAFTGVTNSASGTASFAIYSLDGNTRVCYSGAISTTSWSGAGNQALSAACTLSPGLYWQAWTADNTTATARSAAGFANYFQTANQGSKALGATSTTATSGALPSTISTTITTNNSYPIPFFKLYN